MLLDTVIQAKNNDDTSMMELIQKFQPVIQKYTRSLNYEDAYQDLIVEFIESIQKLNLERLQRSCDGTLVNYISRMIYHSFIKLSKRYASICNHEIRTGDLEETQQYAIENSLIVQMLPEKEELEEWFPSNILSKHQKRILIYFFYNGLSISEIAKTEGVSRQSINKAKNTALKKLKKAISSKK